MGRWEGTSGSSTVGLLREKDGGVVGQEGAHGFDACRLCFSAAGGGGEVKCDVQELRLGM
jgi:hypothetical protein